MGVEKDSEGRRVVGEAGRAAGAPSLGQTKAEQPGPSGLQKVPLVPRWAPSARVFAKLGRADKC